MPSNDSIKERKETKITSFWQFGQYIQQNSNAVQVEPKRVKHERKMYKRQVCW